MASTQRVEHFEVQLNRVIGKGGFGAVYRAKDHSEEPPVECAAKLLKLRSKKDITAAEHEVEVLRLVVGHASVIELRGYFQLDGSSAGKLDAWLFMEIATGGELFDRLVDSGNLTERATRPYAKALVQGVQHCHSKGVVHRDIKLENIMLCAEDPSALKLIDFGLAFIADEGQLHEQRLHEQVGTKSYRAPEICEAKQSGYLGPPVDVWCIGIVIFSLASGFFPLDEAKPTDWRFKRLQQDQAAGLSACVSIYSMYKRACPFTAPLREMLDAMLMIDPQRRISLTEVAAHAWFEPPAAQPAAYEEDDYAAPVVFRSAGCFDDEDEEELPPFEPPSEAMPIVRQPAERGWGAEEEEEMDS